jgi:SAM-dependent methyltransferase
MGGSLHVDPTNEAMARAWDGDEGEFWAANAPRFDRSLALHTPRFMMAAGIAAGERVLDIGCGTGETTRAAARAAGAGSALGVDLSARMLEVARKLAEREGVANAIFLQADAQVHPFTPQQFDVAISRTGAMFFGDPVAAWRNIAAALRPGGRLVLLTWQALERNEWISTFRTALAGGRDLPDPPPEAPTPFSLSDPERVRRLLTSAGFTEPHLAGVDAPMWFGDTPDDACEFVLGVAGWMLDGLDATGRERAVGALRAAIEEHASPDGVRFGSAAWLITTRRGQ